jgi:hypothetical protein
MSIPKNHSTFLANSNVSAQDRIEAIDFVNRLNFAFDHWNYRGDLTRETCLRRTGRYPSQLRVEPQLNLLPLDKAILL